MSRYGATGRYLEVPYRPLRKWRPLFLGWWAVAAVGTLAVARLHDHATWTYLLHWSPALLAFAAALALAEQSTCLFSAGVISLFVPKWRQVSGPLMGRGLVLGLVTVFLVLPAVAVGFSMALHPGWMHPALQQHGEPLYGSAPPPLAG